MDEYAISISDVDAQGSHAFHGTAIEVLDFLDRHDHEGSGMMLSLPSNSHVYNPEAIYKVLQAASGTSVEAIRLKRAQRIHGDLLKELKAWEADEVSTPAEVETRAANLIHRIREFLK